MHQDSIHPTQGRILLESIYEETIFGPDGKVEFEIPPEYQYRYPNTGWYVRGGPSSLGLQRDDLVVLEDEGRDVDRSYYDVFRLILEDRTDGEKYNLIISADAYLPFREIMAKFYANPSTEKHRRISLKDVEGTPWTFEAQDVLDFDIDELAHPTYTLEYIPTKMLYLWVSDSRQKLHYLVDYRRVLLVLKEW